MKKNNNIKLESIIFFDPDNSQINISNTLFKINSKEVISCSFLKGIQGDIYIKNFILQNNFSIIQPFYLFSFAESNINIYNCSFK